eukprot:TRINITY_DN2714_c0_g1_i1.p1 TRINITY_DN2714_c0_g1~~TRINITY_DN2714_c0_g1_i1.p1  ORF type:complete len:332 (-),score=59.08 TRINITY_DN2714_c0_g1_i1:103-1098(-)
MEGVEETLAPSDEVQSVQKVTTPDSHDNKSSQEQDHKPKDDLSDGALKITKHEGKQLHPVSSHESAQGRRYSMEDTFVAFDNLAEQFPSLPKENSYSLYGVFDGHGGKDAAILLEQLIPKRLIDTLDGSCSNIQEALRKTFFHTDKEILTRSRKEGWTNGSTGVLTFLVNSTLYLANLGDSEAVLAKKTAEGYEAVLISEKHKPSSAGERARIEKAGGHVIFGRVMGSLAVARAFGDIEFKHPENNADGDFVSADPFINKVEITDEHEFMIVACDGLWDALTYQAAVDFVVKSRANGASNSAVTGLLVTEALDRGTFDNVTAIVIFFHPSK